MINRLETKLGRLKLDNPVLVASGTFGIEYAQLLDINKLGAFVTKTITMLPKEGNQPPRLFETEAGLLNSIGLQNPGLDNFLQNNLPQIRSAISIPLIVSFSGNTINEFTEMLEIMEEYKSIDGYEVNISCPNVEKGGIAFGTEADMVYNLMRRLSPLTRKELIVKLAPNVTDIARIADGAATGGATAISMINTLYGMAIDPLTGISRIARGIAGYSGIAIKPVALACVYKAVQRVKLPVIGMGGIYNWKDALEFLYAGASAVAIGTSNFINPLASIEIKEDLNKYFIETGSEVAQLIGKVSFES